ELSAKHAVEGGIVDLFIAARLAADDKNDLTFRPVCFHFFGELAKRAAFYFFMQLCQLSRYSRWAGTEHLRHFGKAGSNAGRCLKPDYRRAQPFNLADLVAAGERLREDFELAQMGPRVGQNWERFLTGGGGRGQYRPELAMGGGSDTARERVALALRDLGPGLGDMALRCCCFLEGLETAEKRLGWSARSGKIVLRIALQRLKRHYDDTYGGASPMIG
ncbi:DUF6456 domain-containing protein, partial [Thioclava electrotropha]|uniref:DUF6456 domain-containing protein n=1 Tax=Thioclava electrotropha TaxID=1549850 RepID=UPI0023A85625